MIPILLLAMHTHVRSPLADHQACDGSPAYRAGLPLASIDPEMILEISAPIDPIDTGAIAGYALA